MLARDDRSPIRALASITRNGTTTTVRSRTVGALRVTAGGLGGGQGESCAPIDAGASLSDGANGASAIRRVRDKTPRRATVSGPAVRWVARARARVRARDVDRVTGPQR